MSDALMENLGSADRPGKKKKVMTAAHPRTTFQYECPWGIYLHLLEINIKLSCPYLIDSEAVF